jgi:hypothetical protein
VVLVAAASPSTVVFSIRRQKSTGTQAAPDSHNMQVLLKRSETRHDIHCNLCGQGFRIYWNRSSAAEQATMRAIVLGELRGHHASESGGDKTPFAHPIVSFTLPDWSRAAVSL